MRGLVSTSSFFVVVAVAGGIEPTGYFNIITNYLNINIIIIDRFYIALFSAVEQTHWARM